MRICRLVLLTLVVTSTSALSADDASQESRLISNARQLVFEGKRSGEGYFSPDGRKLIFQSEREAANPFYQQYVLDFETGETTRVSPGKGKTTCGFFQPGSDRVLFASTHADAEAESKQKAELEFRASGKQRRYSWDYDATFDIFSAKQDGSDPVNLTHAPGYDAEGSYSPDGKQIIFCSLRAAFPLEKLPAAQRDRYDKDASSFGDIYLMNADGSNVRRLTDAPGYDGGPFFSPDGQRIVWRHFDESGVIADVWTMKLDGSDKQRVTDFKSMSWAPFYHPSGDYFIFTSNKLGFENFELFLVDAKGAHEPVRVTFTPGFDGLPVFSPDGKKLCWTSGRTGDGKSQLFIADWNDEAARAALGAAPKRGGTAAAEISASPAAGITDPGYSAEITAKDLRSEVEWLADEKREGRMTGSAGAQETAKWIANYFRANGLKSFAENYALPFQFNAGERVLPEKTKLEISTGDGKPPRNAKLDADFRPLAFSENGETSSEIVFAGYGLVAPGEGAGRYDSYAGLDVKDKIVLIFRYVPEGIDQARRAQLNRYSGLRYKAMLARERGAKGVLVVTGPNSPNAGELLALNNDNTNASSGIIAASINGATADSLLAPSGKSLKDLQTGLDQENPHAAGGFVLAKVKVQLACGVEHLKKTDADVVGYVEPAKGSDEYILVGAHYDHLGRGGSSSLERTGEENEIHPGADDNASGTAWMMELAASLAKERTEHPEKFRRGVIFAGWSGEEIGIIGSVAFSDKPPVPLDKITAYINADMVGRLRDNKLTLQGVGSSHAWRKMIEKRNVAAGFNLMLQDDPYLPTDVTSFYTKNVPVLNFFTGAHDDYHRPTDTAEKINYEGLERIAKFSQQLVLDLAQAPERPDLAKVERTSQDAGGRETLRAYLGTIPDYTTEVKGVKLSGVRGASPAEKAGLKGGDVIVEFAGQEIANIYDYTYALDAVKIGKPVQIVIERDGKQMTLTVTPEARK
jgi:hypothetical protein